MPSDSTAPPLVPARILNEFVYCPRLAILEWVEGEFLDSADTVEGALQHRAVDRPGRRFRPSARRDEDTPADGSHESGQGAPPAAGVTQLRAVELSDPGLGLIAKLDLVEIEGSCARPVDVKKGKRPHTAKRAYDPERVQLCAQGLLLRANGYESREGALYFAGSNERVAVPFDDELVAMTLEALSALRAAADAPSLPPPLEDSPKCVGCSLAPICLPDETRYAPRADARVRPLFPAGTHRFPMFVQTPGAVVRKKGEVLEVWAEEEKIGEMRLLEISQLVLMGRAHVTEPAVHELIKREIPIAHVSQGGWLQGVTEGLPHKNIHLRQQQFRLADDPRAALAIARALVRAKILNQRVLLRRNGGDDLHRPVLDELRRAARDRVNALLSFAYSMLTREWLAVCRTVGFDPYLGYLHKPRYGRPALALDLMEPFRPLIADSVVIRVINNGEVRPSHFVERLGAVNLTSHGRRAFLDAFEQRLTQEVAHPVFGYRCDYRRVFEVEARLLARHLTGELPAYHPLVTR